MDIELNKKNAIAFYKMAYEGNPKKAVELYVGSEYIQHNPEVEDGKKDLLSISLECTMNSRIKLFIL